MSLVDEGSQAKAMSLFCIMPMHILKPKCNTFTPISRVVKVTGAAISNLHWVAVLCEEKK
jgi:hypothetical protein